MQKLIENERLPEPDESRNEKEKAEIARIQFLVADKNAPIPLDVIDKALNQMAFFVQMRIVWTWHGAIFACGNHGNGTTGTNQGQKGVGIIAGIGNHILGAASCQQSWRLRTIMALTRREDKVQWQAQRIDDDMDLCAEAPTAATKRLGLLSPFGGGCPCRTGMGTNHRTIQQQAFQVRLFGTTEKERFPDAGFFPARKALVDTVPFAVAFRQFTPLTPSASDPQHPLHKAPTGAALADINPRTAMQKAQDVPPLAVLQATTGLRRLLLVPLAFPLHHGIRTYDLEHSLLVFVFRLRLLRFVLTFPLRFVSLPFATLLQGAWQPYFSNVNEA